ncbi:hypothetical protein IWQ60_009814 [Tieghemiomyces parasiticus]|uniref:BHLH domain-containing protein n=1 Tax=Tieghemiomyces parasiticus TaxID=78921 RepID=A0A9W7ZWE6_9FUNG|nr:hypothetical protein IWQ60_009814 [Tieghemiomyces parasiticus]
MSAQPVQAGEPSNTMVVDSRSASPQTTDRPSTSSTALFGGFSTVPNTRCSSPVFDDDEHLSDSSEAPNNANKPMFLNFTSDLAPFNGNKKPKTRKSNVYRVSGVNILNRNSVDSHTVMERLQRRRENHNFVERRRRDTINNTIMELADVIPSAQKDGSKPNKGSILRKAVEYIRELQDDNQQLRERLGLPSADRIVTPSGSGYFNLHGGIPGRSPHELSLSNPPSAYSSRRNSAVGQQVEVMNLMPGHLSATHITSAAGSRVPSAAPSAATSPTPGLRPLPRNSSQIGLPSPQNLLPGGGPQRTHHHHPASTRRSPTQLPPLAGVRDTHMRDTVVVPTPLPSVTNTPAPSVPNSPGISPNRPIEEFILPNLAEHSLHGAPPVGHYGPVISPAKAGAPVTTTLTGSTAPLPSLGAALSQASKSPVYPSPGAGSSGATTPSYQPGYPTRAGPPSHPMAHGHPYHPASPYHHHHYSQHGQTSAVNFHPYYPPGSHPTPVTTPGIQSAHGSSYHNLTAVAANVGGHTPQRSVSAFNLASANGSGMTGGPVPLSRPSEHSPNPVHGPSATVASARRPSYSQAGFQLG